MTTPRKRQGRWHRDPALARKLPLDAIKHGEQILALLDQTQFLTATQVAHRFFTVPIQGERKTGDGTGPGNPGGEPKPE